MSYLQFLNAQAPHLPKAFNLLANSAMKDALDRALPSGKPPEEPDFVASLVKHGTPGIKHLLDLVFSGSGIKVTTTGVFCHQSPMVKFNHAGKRLRCELGDVLFIHIHRDKAGFVQRNALLLQAKMTAPASPQLAIPKKEHHQLALYQHWPTFFYDMAGDPLHGKSRSVSPHSRHSGAQYLLIDSDTLFNNSTVPAGHYPMAVWMAETPLYTTNTFGNQLFAFLSMGSGRLFSERGVAKGWSKVIWDLLDNGFRKGFNRKRTRHVSTPGSRMAGDAIPKFACYAMGYGELQYSLADEILGFQAGALRNSEGNGTIPPQALVQMEFDDPASGISLIAVETDEFELAEEFAHFNSRPE